MNVIAINSSPRTGSDSKTEIMLNNLVQGMRDAGAQVEVINLREKIIHQCIGCYTCWTKTPGQCVHKDDMSRELFAKWLAADIAVYASPLYFHRLNAAMETFIERTLPAAQPFFEENPKGGTSHPLRHPIPAAVYLVVCGFPELSEFDALTHFLQQTRLPAVKHIAYIMRPAAEHMASFYFKEKRRDILEATIQAGRQIVTDQAVSPETLARIQQPVTDTETFRQLGNIFWKTCIEAGVTPKVFGKKKMVPRPDSIETFMHIFPIGLNKSAVEKGKAVLQVNFTGTIQGSCHFVIENAGATPSIGAHTTADIVIDTPFELWMDIMTGKADGQQMFMEQKYTVSGDLNLMLQLFQRKQDT